MFLNPIKPLSTCYSEDCEGCTLQNRLYCYFSGRELLRFFAITFPPFILEGIGIARINSWLLLPCIVLAISYFSFVEIRAMCSHCPHYTEPGSKKLQCWANYGSIKLCKYCSGSMTQGEIVAFFTGLVFIAGYPLAILIVGIQWLLLVLCTVTVIVMAVLMGRLVRTLFEFRQSVQQR